MFSPPTLLVMCDSCIKTAPWHYSFALVWRRIPEKKRERPLLRQQQLLLQQYGYNRWHKAMTVLVLDVVVVSLGAEQLIALVLEYYRLAERDAENLAHVRD